LLGCGSIRAQPTATKPVLELGIGLINQSYCAANAKTTSLEMDLTLRYTNRSNQRIILYRGHDLFYQTRIRREADAPSEPYTILSINSRYFDEELEAIDRPVPGREFVNLAPGASYERSLKVGIGVVGAKGDRANDAIRAGEHTLQLVVSAWYKTWPLGATLRERWQSRGYLWLDPLVSNQLPFSAEPPKTLAACR
jgi:hypothetical protein